VAGKVWRHTSHALTYILSGLSIYGLSGLNREMRNQALRPLPLLCFDASAWLIGNCVLLVELLPQPFLTKGLLLRNHDLLPGNGPVICGGIVYARSFIILIINSLQPGVAGYNRVKVLSWLSRRMAFVMFMTPCRLPQTMYMYRQHQLQQGLK